MSEVNLAGITKPSAYTGCNTAEELVVWAARVSNPSNQNNNETAPRLIKYLIREKHWSPMEMVDVSMEIKTTRDIARQILRHRSFSFQEYSQRYANPTDDLGFVRREARLQDTKNRQNSIDVGPDENRLAEEWQVMQQQAINAAEMAYKWAISRGIAKEQARAVLPEGNTESVLIMKGSLRSWIHYIDIRADKATQKEHRVIAEKAKAVITQHFPNVAIAIEWNGEAA